MTLSAQAALANAQVLRDEADRTIRKVESLRSRREAFANWQRDLTEHIRHYGNAERDGLKVTARLYVIRPHRGGNWNDLDIHLPVGLIQQYLIDQIRDCDRRLREMGLKP